MQTLILMRHAKSSWSDPRLRDHERPLNKRGRASARVMGNWLRAQGFVPDAAVSSTSQRTLETFEGLGFGCPVRFTRALYHAEAEDILGLLQEEIAPTVLMLGHNPGISDFAHRIVRAAPEHGRFWDYPTCATLVVSFDLASWAEATWGLGEATGFAIPREVGAGAP